MDTKSVLLDVLKHTAGLGIIHNIKVTGTDTETRLDAIDADKTVILNGRLHAPVPEFVGEFGIGNLGLLSSLTKLSNYQGEGVKINVIREERDGTEIPTTLTFQDANDSKDQYRFMSKKIVDQAMRVGTFKGAVWDVTITPTAQKVSNLSEVASIYTGIEASFSVTSDGTDLVFEIGSAEGGIVGRRVFSSNIEGSLDTKWRWPLATFLSILKLGMNGTCVVKFSNQGVCQIDIDSGIGYYSFILPAIVD